MRLSRMFALMFVFGRVSVLLGGTGDKRQGQQADHKGEGGATQAFHACTVPKNG